MRIIGIDLGTTNAVMAAMEAGQPIVIPNAEGERVTPAVVSFDPKTGERTVGTPAKRQAITNPENTIFSVKRLLGCEFSIPSIRRGIALAAYRTKPDIDGNTVIRMGGRWYSAREVSAMVLQKLRRDAASHLGEPIDGAVITVPAYFNEIQRKATRDAAKIAGLKVARLINEPAAASLAYGFGQEKQETIAVYHLGGGFFDVSILRYSQGILKVLAYGGDAQLGGDDVDRQIVSWVCDEFMAQQGIGLGRDGTALARLREAAEEAKCALSVLHRTEVNVPFLASDADDHVDLRMMLTRAEFEKLVSDLLQRTLEPCEQAMADATCRATDADEVLLVGQQTRTPAVQGLVREFFGREPCKRIYPGEAVAEGAAIQAGVLAGEVRDVLLVDVTPLTLSIGGPGGVATAVIKRNTSIPTRGSRILSTVEDPRGAIDIEVYQGERPMAADNVLLGQVRLDGLAQATLGTSVVEVTFDVDAEANLNVSVEHRATGQEQTMTMPGGFSPPTHETRPQESQTRDVATTRTQRARPGVYERGDNLEPQDATGGSVVCPACQNSIPEGKRFCGYCGSRLDANPGTLAGLDGPTGR
jgi:molecular chaperone DnaK